MDSSLPEAPITMFTNYKRVDGFEVSLTVRGRVLRDVATELNNAIETIVKAGGTPVVRGSGFNKPKAPSKPCPTHPDKELRERESKEKPGEKYWSHSKGMYPNFGEWCTGKGYPSEQAGQSSAEIGASLNEPY